MQKRHRDIETHTDGEKGGVLTSLRLLHPLACFSPGGRIRSAAIPLPRPGTRYKQRKVWNQVLQNQAAQLRYLCEFRNSSQPCSHEVPTACNTNHTHTQPNRPQAKQANSIKQKRNTLEPPPPPLSPPPTKPSLSRPPPRPTPISPHLRVSIIHSKRAITDEGACTWYWD